MDDRVYRMIKKRLTVTEGDGLYSPVPPLFDLCGDNDLMSLSLTGVQPFLDWVGWQQTDVYRLVREYISYHRAAATVGGTPTAGWMANPCDDPNGVESKYCELVIEGFARLRRGGPTRDITRSGLNYCDVSPRFRIDGGRVDDDREYDIYRATEVIVQDLAGMLIDGNASTPGQSDGLENLVKTGHECAILDSIVVDWNGNGMDGGAGATWNGTAISETSTFVDLLMAIVRRIRQRVHMTPTLAASGLREGDLILLMPGAYVPCVLDAYTCWSVCAGDSTQLQSFEARRFRDALNGGMFGAGQITIEGVTIPIMPFDFGLMNSNGTFDAYVLTRGVGPRRFLYGQYNNMNLVAAKKGEGYAAIDGGRLLTWSTSDHTCEQRIVEMQPRLVLEAPWAQARVQNIQCNALGGAISSDPWSSNFPDAESEGVG